MSAQFQNRSDAKPSTESAARIALPAVEFIRNPLEVLGFSPAPFQGRSPEEAMKLITIAYRFWVQIIHPDKLDQDPRNPKNGGDSGRWTKRLESLPRFDEIQRAYDDLKDPSTCAAAIADFKVRTPSEQLNLARSVQDRILRDFDKIPIRLTSFLLERFDPRRNPVNSWRSGVVKLSSLSRILTENPEGNLSAEALRSAINSRRSLSFNLVLDSSGRIEGRPGDCIAFVLAIPFDVDGLKTFVKLLLMAGLKTLPDNFSLGSGLAGADQKEQRLSIPYRLGNIDKSALTHFLPFVSAVFDEADNNKLQILVTQQQSSRGSLISMEGIILGFSESTPSHERRIPARQPKPRGKK